ncbi:MAG: BrnT family toxin [Alphaproteobacteria bacterium]|nr:BrnT family toxin [Alphaproteobacteria bacterium]
MKTCFRRIRSPSPAKHGIDPTDSQAGGGQARMPPKGKLQGFRPHREIFSEITWDDGNRREHEARRPNPSFVMAKLLDWSRIKKRKDTEHRDRPERFQALVGWRSTVCFVVYVRVNGNLHIISIRYANDEECSVFHA